MGLPVPNVPMGMPRKPSCLVNWPAPAGRDILLISLTDDSKKERQKERQRRKYDIHRDHEKRPDEVNLDEASVIGEVDRPRPPSEKPESRRE